MCYRSIVNEGIMMDASDKDNNMTHTLSSSYKHPIIFDGG